MSHEASLNRTDKKYWFPAKETGLGWSVPRTWQGWMVFAFYLAGIALAGMVWPPDTMGRVFFPAIVILTLLLVLMCWWKGEPLGGRVD